MVRVGGVSGQSRAIELGAATSPVTVMGPLRDIINGEKQSGGGRGAHMSLFLSAPSICPLPSCLFSSPFLFPPLPPLAQLVPPPRRSLQWEASLPSPPEFLYFSLSPSHRWLLAIGYPLWLWLARSAVSLSSFILFHMHH